MVKVWKGWIFYGGWYWGGWVGVGWVWRCGWVLCKGVRFDDIWRIIVGGEGVSCVVWDVMVGVKVEVRVSGFI